MRMTNQKIEPYLINSYQILKLTFYQSLHGMISF